MVLRRHFRGEGLRGRAMRAAAVSVGGTAGQQILRLASNLVLTRLLFPEAFGMMALVQTFMTGLAMFSDIGLRPSIIQNPRGEEPAFLHTAFTIQAGRGAMLWLAACAIAWPASIFYAKPEVAWLLPVVGLNALIQGFQTTRLAVAGRHMRIGRQTLIALGTQAVGLVVMVTLALVWPSVWALVIGGLVSNLIGTFAGHRLMPGTPDRLGWDRSAAHDLMRFGRFIFVSTLAGFFVNQGDKLMMGRLVSFADLGIYNVAYFFAAFPAMFAGAVAERVLFPLYRQIRPSESAENRRKIGRARAHLTRVTIATFGLMAIIAGPLIELLYDARYHAAGPMLVILALGGIPKALTLGNGQLLLAEGDSRNFAALVLLRGAMTFVLILGGFWLLGLFGILLASGLLETLTYPLQQFFLHRYRGTDLRRDAGFAVLGLAFAGVALWVNWDSVQGLFILSRRLAPSVTGSWDPVALF